MTRSMMARWVAVSIAVLGFAPVEGQSNPQQTPEAAQAFIKKLADLGQVELSTPQFYTKFKSYSTRGYNGVYELTTNSWTSDKSPEILSISSFQKCNTAIANNYGDNMKAYEQEPSSYSRNAKMTVPGTETWDPWLPHIRYLHQHGIEWSLVTTLEHNDSSQSITLRGNAFDSGSIYLKFKSADLATRAAFAMDVIRRGCDPTAGGAF